MDDTQEFASTEIRIFSLLGRAGFHPRTIYDIGAANGTWSAFVSQVFPDATFHMFEPLAGVLPSFDKDLKWQLQTHPLFRLHTVALGDASKKVRMRLHPDGYSSTTLDMGSHPDYQESCEVTQYRLDEYVRTFKLPLPDILKLDTQGSERAILSQAGTCLTRAKIVFAETWFCRGYGPETPLLSELQQLLDKANYELVELGYRFYDNLHRLYGCDAFFLERTFAKDMAPLMPSGTW
jgi:FkbM family methyltransferase